MQVLQSAFEVYRRRACTPSAERVSRAMYIRLAEVEL